MELKGYQQKVIADLDGYLERVRTLQHTGKAFEQHWEEKIGPYNPLDGKGMRPYQNNIPGVPHICLKVPTAGGKTFIAVNALKTIFAQYEPGMPKVVVWLVPWSNLLDQTVNALRNPDHPYRRKLNELFQHRVQVFQKEDLLQGASFSPTVVREELCIFVMSFASLRAKDKNKEGRKVYQENGQLAAFPSTYTSATPLLEDRDETSLINVIRSLHPAVVLDESHNAESDLSVDMLQILNPSIVLDLTATPRGNSNIVSMVPAIELKKEHMVKLPVIVYNHQDKTEVIDSALHLQRKLEELAITQEKAGGKYIRPIVLFQAQPRTGEEKITYEKLKATLIKLKIPEAQIKIKTAEIDELKGIDLLDRNCPVRFIITINALKEGWDCPFAYVLASLADKSSAVDVEQILGRVLRQPYVMKHAKPLLNVSYVLTASAKFTETLGSIVKGLQSSGFSDRDYRNRDTMTEETKEKAADQQLDMLLNPNTQPATTETTDEIDTERITYDPTAPITTEQPTDATTISGHDATTGVSAPVTPPIVTEIEKMAEQENAQMEEQVRWQAENPYNDTLFTEMPEKVTKYQMVPAAKSVAEAIRLPQFMHEIPGSLFTDNGAVKAVLNPEYLLQDFRLSDEDTRIDFDQIVGEMFKVDLELRDAATDDYTPRQTLLTKEAQGSIAEYILSKPHDAQIKDLSGQICALMGSMFPIADQEIKEFVGRILKKLDANQIRDMIVHRSSYTARIKAKIKEHSDRYAEKRFYDWLGVDRITTQPNWKFQPFIVPAKLGPALSKSLYDREAEMSEFEHRLISQIVSLDNIAYWHRNFVKGNGFAINGFKSNHYPDFILITKTGKVILVETKGADRDNSDSKAKCKLGKTWAAKAGQGFYYFMVFEKNPIEDAYSLEQAKALIAGL